MAQRHSSVKDVTLDLSSHTSVVLVVSFVLNEVLHYYYNNSSITKHIFNRCSPFKSSILTRSTSSYPISVVID